MSDGSDRRYLKDYVGSDDFRDVEVQLLLRGLKALPVTLTGVEE